MGKRGPASGRAQKGAPTAIRFTPELKRKLAAAARKNSVSFSEEVSARLELSFSKSDARFGDDTTYAFCRLLALIYEDIYRKSGHRWARNPWAFSHAYQATLLVLKLVRPEGASEIPDDLPIFEDLREMGQADAIPKAKEIVDAYPIWQTSVARALRRLKHAGPGEPLHAIAAIIQRRLPGGMTDGGLAFDMALAAVLDAVGGSDDED